MFAVVLVVWLVLQYFQGDRATLPFSVLTQRTAAAANLYTLFSGAAFVIEVYYIPIWFQSVRGNTAVQSGIKQLALVVSLSATPAVSGGLVFAIGYASPFLILDSVSSAVGAGLLYTVEAGTTVSKLIGYQISVGIGLGMGLNQTVVAVQTALPPKLIPKGVSSVPFTRLLGSSLASPVAQSVLQSALVRQLGQSSASDVLSDGGASNARSQLEQVYGLGTPAFATTLHGFNTAVTRTLLVALILCYLTTPFGLLVGWKSVKKTKKGKKGGKGEKEQDASDGADAEKRVE